MNEHAEDLARRLLESPCDRTLVTAALEMIEDGRGGELFRHLLNAVKHDMPEGGQHVQTSALMVLLEEMMNADRAVGGYLMAKLYPHAGAAKDHTTFNAIELWINDSSSLEPASALDALSREPGRPRMQARYKAWSDAIRERNRS